MNAVDAEQQTPERVELQIWQEHCLLAEVDCLM